MAEYIEREALIAELEEEIDFNTSMYTEEQNKYFNMGLKCALRDVRHQPAADVQEVRHERWKKDWCDNNLIGHEYEECTGCGCSMIDTNQFWESHYRPNCGAKMDGKGDA